MKNTTVKEKELLMKLMMAMKMRRRFIAEVATFLKTREQYAAMILYLRDHMEATEEEITDVLVKIIEYTRSQSTALAAT